MDKHNAVVMGMIVRKKYEAWNIGSIAKIVDNDEFVKYEEIWSGELNDPPIKSGDSFYITDKNLLVEVEMTSRNTENGYTYFTDYVIERIEDEETDKSKKEAEEKLKKFNESLNSDTKQEISANKKWWQIWK
jgi:hypothetical protein